MEPGEDMDRALGIPGFPVFGVSGTLGFIVSGEGVRAMPMSILDCTTQPRPLTGSCPKTRFRAILYKLYRETGVSGFREWGTDAWL